MALVAGRALQWHWMGWDGPELTEQWSERLSSWAGLSFCTVDLLEHPLFSWPHRPFFSVPGTSSSSQFHGRHRKVALH